MNTYLVTPNPATMEIDLGDKKLTIPDITTPNWFGDYQGGKLAVYVAEVTGNIIEGSITVLASYTEHTGADFITYACYSKDTSLPYIVSHLQAIVFDAYKDSIISSSLVLPASGTLH